jgi:hypothetical protein
MCRYRGTDRLLLSIEIACSCVSTIGKESSGEKQHDDDVCAGVVVFVAARERGGVEVRTRRPEGAGGQGEQRGGENFLRSRKLFHPSTFYLCLHSQHVELEEDPAQ